MKIRTTIRAGETIERSTGGGGFINNHNEKLLVADRRSHLVPS